LFFNVDDADEGENPEFTTLRPAEGQTTSTDGEWVATGKWNDVFDEQGGTKAPLDDLLDEIYEGADDDSEGQVDLLGYGVLVPEGDGNEATIRSVSWDGNVSYFMNAKADDLSDVTPDKKFYGQIAWLSNEGITTGYSDGTFRPRNKISREATVAYLYRDATEPEDYTWVPFSDVNKDDKFLNEIAWAWWNGVTGGYADGTFRPTGKITREAMAAYLYRYNGENVEEAENEFVDVDEDDKFADAITWLANKGI